jgi:hypothetical protein
MQKNAGKQDARHKVSLQYLCLRGKTALRLQVWQGISPGCHAERTYAITFFSAPPNSSPCRKHGRHGPGSPCVVCLDACSNVGNGCTLYSTSS